MIKTCWEKETTRKGLSCIESSPSVQRLLQLDLKCISVCVFSVCQQKQQRVNHMEKQSRIETQIATTKCDENNKRTNTASNRQGKTMDTVK